MGTKNGYPDSVKRKALQYCFWEIEGYKRWETFAHKSCFSNKLGKKSNQINKIEKYKKTYEDQYFGVRWDMC